MSVNNQAPPVRRHRFDHALRAPLHAGGIQPSVCTAADNNAVGQCFDQHGAVPGRFNCAACCALRGATGWHNPANGVVVAC
ncbi:hypothetical protein [Trinickia fusca]|uniref:hypothetical protein n=1 Tax=Trinickia fusca TaxID=2419777 RepID=UPI000EB59D1A|nr:hypothetical protein [Trinickia fusca]